MIGGSQLERQQSIREGEAFSFDITHSFDITTPLRLFFRFLPPSFLRLVFVHSHFPSFVFPLRFPSLPSFLLLWFLVALSHSLPATKKQAPRQPIHPIHLCPSLLLSFFLLIGISLLIGVIIYIHPSHTSLSRYSLSPPPPAFLSLHLPALPSQQTYSPHHTNIPNTTTITDYTHYTHYTLHTTHYTANTSVPLRLPTSLNLARSLVFSCAKKELHQPYHSSTATQQTTAYNNPQSTIYSNKQLATISNITYN